MPRSKYGSKKVKYEGLTFDSKKEAGRYFELVLLEKAGHIKDLTLQPVFELMPKYRHKGKAVREITYRADFAYTDTATGKRVYEDTKGYLTEVYKLKKKLLLYKYPDIDFREL